MILSGCGSKATPAAEAEPIRNPLEITPHEELKNQIRTGNPEWESVSGTLRVAGRVEADGTRLARVSSPVTGRLVDVNAVEGQRVRRGEVLAKVYGADLSGAQSAFLKAHSQHQVQERALARARQLLAADVIGSAELQRREAELQQAGADLAASREQLSVLGFSAKDIDELQSSRAVHSTTQIVSSIDGIVLERRATEGQIVEAVTPVFIIADLSNVWLVADVPEQSAGSIGVGKAVEAEIPALPDHKVRGTLNFVSAIVNPETRTVRTRMNLPNPRGIYKPAMLTTMTLVDGAERRLVVPAGAVVREDNADHVFVRTGPDTYLMRRVTTGDDLGKVRVILDGLKESETVVVEGAFHLNNERKRQVLGGDSD